MIGYVMVGTNDIKQSLNLYDKILPFAGMKKIEATSDYVGYASIFSDDEKITFYITKPYNGKNATFGNGSMIAFLCQDKQSVDNFHRIGLENGEVFWPDEEWVLMWEEFCEEYTILTYSGYAATGLLSLSSIVSLFFLVQTGRQIRRDVNLFSFVEFDFRIVVLSGGLTTITPILWRVSNHGVISDSEVLTLSWGFYLTVLGGLLGLIAFGLLYRSDDLGGGLERIKENRKLTKEAAIAHKEMMMREYAEQKKADEEANLLHVTEAAVRAKINAENNPKDPLGWLLMAEAMEKANRHEEALRGRRIAMDLMEKQEEE